MADKDKIVYLALNLVHAQKDWNARSGDWTKVVDPETGQDWEGFCKSIANEGIKTPLEVRQDGNRYFIIAGHRRHAAATLAKLADVPCIVRDVDAVGARLRNIQENTDRESLKGADLAWALADLVKLSPEKMTQQAIAESIGRGQPYVGKLLKIMTGVKPGITKAWREANVPITVKEMYALCDIPKEKQDEEFERIVKGKATGPAARGPNAWVDTAKKSAYKLGETFGKAKRLGIIEGVDKDSLLIVEELVKYKSEAKITQRKAIAKQFDLGFADGQAEPEEDQGEDEDEDAA